ncbi:hypothetical protein Nizo2891_2848 [Lactiplantibacillus plantarum]|nr:hypothetical protein Nizo2891_2848 [Lactiplantibacillus plantarum]
MTDKSKQSKTLKQLQEENNLLRIRVAYLENSSAFSESVCLTHLVMFETLTLYFGAKEFVECPV